MSATAATPKTEIKRLVDLVDRGPEDDYFFPASAETTLFRRVDPLVPPAVSEIVELGFLGHCAWGSRITIPVRATESGDLLQWLCIRFKPRSWLSAGSSGLEQRFLAGTWDYANASGAWIWANSLGSAAIQKVEWEIGDTVIEQWGGEWMDVWARRSLDLNRAPVWDADLFATHPITAAEPTRNLITPTEDGYVYAWLPLTFLRRAQTAFPLLALGRVAEFRVHVTFRPFADVVRLHTLERRCRTEVPLGATIRVADVTGPTPIPVVNYTVPGGAAPAFEEVSVLAGVVHVGLSQRAEYQLRPMELMYEPVTHMVFDIADKVAMTAPEGGTVSMQAPLRDLNGPIKELLFFLRRKDVWKFNEWTTYGALLQGERDSRIRLSESERESERGGRHRHVIPASATDAAQKPLLRRARLLVDNAVFRDDTEQWWRYETAMQLPGGVRLSEGMVYGHAFGSGGDILQPTGTVNASRVLIRLDLEIDGSLAPEGWELHVFGIGVNWMRFVDGVVGPLFKD